MALPPKVEIPGGFVPAFAVSFGAASSESQSVDLANPLPVQTRFGASQAAPLTGNAAASGVVGPFSPEPGRPIWVTLAVSWSGTVTVQRSTDDGVTRRPLTLAGGPWGVFTAHAQEAVGEETVAGATWWLDFQRTAGTLIYEVRQ